MNLGLLTNKWVVTPLVSVGLALSAVTPLPHAPVQLTDTTEYYTAPFYFLEKEQPQWNALEQQIIQSNAQRIVITWNGGGGYVSMGENFIQIIKDAEQKGQIIKLVITQTAISEHAMVVCAASSYEMTKGATLHYHAEFTRAPIVGTKIYVDDESRWVDCVNKKILSDNEVAIIVHGHKRIIINDDGSHTLADDWSMCLTGEPNDSL